MTWLRHISSAIADRARKLKSELAAIRGAAFDPRTPIYARVLAAVVIAYALSPIDLVPDFIPVLGHLDDLVLVPLGLWAVLKLIPPDVIAEHRARIAAGTILPRSRTAGIIIAAIWIVTLSAVGAWMWRHLVEP